MLFAGALGGYYAYKLGADAEHAAFETQYLAAVTTVRPAAARAHGA